MANLFGLLAQPIKSDILGSFERGREQVRQEERERFADQQVRAKASSENRFRQLAGEAYTAAPEQRQQLLSQAAAVDPRGAMQLDQQFAQSEERKQTLKVNTAKVLSGMPQQYRAETYRGMIPTLRAAGLDAPEEYTPQMDAQMQAWAGGPPKPISVSAGETLLDPVTREPIYSPPAAAPKPMDPMGQLAADHRAGLISDQDFAARRKMLTTRETPQGQFQTLTPQEIADAGLAPGTSAQRDAHTGKIDVLSKRDTTASLSQKDATTAKMKLNTVSLARQQLNAIKEAFANGTGGAGMNAFGPGQGMLPTELGKQFDSRVDQMRSTLTALTRVPGVGAMSDYETRLDQSKFPARGDYESVTADKIQQLDNMLNLIERGYGDLLSNGTQGGSAGAAPPKSSTSDDDLLRKYGGL